MRRRSRSLFDGLVVFCMSVRPLFIESTLVFVEEELRMSHPGPTYHAGSAWRVPLEPLPDLYLHFEHGIIHGEHIY